MASVLFSESVVPTCWVFPNVRFVLKYSYFHPCTAARCYNLGRSPDRCKTSHMTSHQFRQMTDAPGRELSYTGIEA